MRLTSLLVCFLAFSLQLPAWAQQFGSIHGRVTTSDGGPAEAVSIGILGRPYAGVSDREGKFNLTGIPAGTYVLAISYVGLKAIQQEVMVVAGQRAIADFQLTESTAELEEVVVQGARHNKFNRTTSEYVAKMPLSNLENPQAYVTVPKELLTEQLVFTADDATRNVAGMQRMWEATGRGGDGGGFYTSRGFVVSSQLRNGVAGNVTSDIDAINLEKLEVIKGPSATLFGSSLTSYGGLINRVTKKPLESFGGEALVAAGSYGFHRVSADVNLVDDNASGDAPKKLAFRLNTAYQYENSFQDKGYTPFNQSMAVAPSLQYRVNDRLTVNLDAEIFKGYGVGKQLIFFYNSSASLGADRADKLPLDYRQSYIGPGLEQDSRSTNLFGQVSYKIAPGFTSTTLLTSSHSFSNGNGQYFYLTNAGTTGQLDSLQLVRADQSTDNSRSTTLEAQQLFNGDFTIGGKRNRIVLGLDFLRTQGNITFLGTTFDAVPLQAAFDYRSLNGSALDAAYAAAGGGGRYLITQKTNTFSAFISDVIDIMPNLSVLAALRADKFDNHGGLYYSEVAGYGQFTLSPKFGLVYQPIKDRLALFANYQNSFKNLGAFVDTRGFAGIAKPEQANQMEGGVKLDAAGGRISATLSYYEIQVSNILRQTPTDIFINAQTQNGTQLSRGVELSLTANPLRGFNIVAGFGYNHSEFVNTSEDVNGRRPNTAGSPILANAWLSYRQPTGRLRGLGAGFGGNYASDNRIQNTATNVFTLPAYTVLNASIFYDQPKYRISAKVDNLTNQMYWTGYTTMNPQKLRSIVGSVAYKF